MPETYWRQPGYMHCAWELFTKNKEEMQKFKETGNSRYINQSDIDK